MHGCLVWNRLTRMLCKVWYCRRYVICFYVFGKKMFFLFNYLFKKKERKKWVTPRENVTSDIMRSAKVQFRLHIHADRWEHSLDAVRLWKHGTLLSRQQQMFRTDYTHMQADLYLCLPHSTENPFFYGAAQSFLCRARGCCWDANLSWKKHMSYLVIIILINGEWVALHKRKFN